MLSDRIRDRMVKERKGLINKGAERQIRKVGNPTGMDGWRVAVMHHSITTVIKMATIINS